MNIELLRFLDARGVRLSFTALQRIPSDIPIYESLRVLELSVMATEVLSCRTPDLDPQVANT